MAIVAKLMRSAKGSVLAICDESLLGNTYKEGKVVLDLKKYRNFFEGETIDEKSEELREMISEANSINIVGEDSISILAKLGYDTSAVRKVSGIPHLQIYKIGSLKKKRLSGA